MVLAPQYKRDCDVTWTSVRGVGLVTLIDCGPVRKRVAIRGNGSDSTLRSALTLAATIGLVAPCYAAAQDAPPTDPNRPGLPVEARPDGAPLRVDPVTGRPFPKSALPTDPVDADVQRRLVRGQTSSVPAFIALPNGSVTDDRPMTRFVDRATNAQALPGTTVRGRRQPEYQPPGVRIGNLMFRPQLAAGVLYDANVYVEERPRDDIVGSAFAGFDLMSNGGRRQVSLGGFVRRRQLATYKTENATTYRIAGQGRYQASGRVTLATDLSHERILLERSAVEEVSALALPNLYDFTQGEVGAQVDYGDTRINTLLQFSRTHFSDNLSTEGIRTDQSFRNFRGYGGNLLVEHAIVGQRFAYLEIDGQVRRFDSIEARLRSNGYTLSVIGGLRGELTQLIRGNLGIGMIRVDFDSPATPTLTGFTIDAKLDWLIRERTTISLAAGREPRTVAQRNARSALLTTISFRVDEEIRRNFIASLILRRQQTDYVGDVRRATATTVTLGGEWLLDRHWRVRPQISYFRRTDRGFDLDIGPSGGQVGISVGYQF